MSQRKVTGLALPGKAFRADPDGHMLSFGEDEQEFAT
jgi:hypothetical protein